MPNELISTESFSTRAREAQEAARNTRNQARALIEEIDVLMTNPELNRDQIQQLQNQLAPMLPVLEQHRDSLHALWVEADTLSEPDRTQMRFSLGVSEDATHVVIDQARKALAPIPEPAQPTTLPEVIDGIREELDAAIRNALEQKRDLCGFALQSLAKLYRERPETIPPEAWNQGINPFVQRSQFTRCQRPAPGTTTYWRNIPTPGQTPTTP